MLPDKLVKNVRQPDNIGDVHDKSFLEMTQGTIIPRVRSGNNLVFPGYGEPNPGMAAILAASGAGWKPAPPGKTAARSKTQEVLRES